MTGTKRAISLSRNGPSVGVQLYGWLTAGFGTVYGCTGGSQLALDGLGGSQEVAGGKQDGMEGGFVIPQTTTTEVVHLLSVLSSGFKLLMWTSHQMHEGMS